MCERKTLTIEKEVKAIQKFFVSHRYKPVEEDVQHNSTPA